ncbi:MAG TPA: type II toxin-antitoxin system prevent-host-death family antitoxin [Polyangiaceae bacterium]|nr:type II toxin-antitoxin system prevent-host-death family antitoxin [Polyangiaceae bacterium]
MRKTVGIREAKANLSYYLDLAQAGTDVVVTDRGKPVVRLMPIVVSEKRSEQAVLEDMAESGMLELGTGTRRKKGRGSVKPSGGVSISKMVRDMRR